MVNRYPRWWSLYIVAKSFFYVAGIISLVFYGVIYTAAALTNDYSTYSEYVIGFGCWTLLFAPFILNYSIAKKRKQKIQSVLSEIRATGHFNPTKDSEGWLFWKNTYIGFDYRKAS
ncbi:hypothetical protein [Pantoea cypripedii]|uniref:Uncharacterized protein n=1 Tax=Pantoea cypripedii TaxID=55209 RepID=A0A1X1EMK7_PANCY|nr:hypothetical protein [Pantoea cypripedii]ORM90187.1 hypothetical protein HA50_26965 [Pantoea cypripedii]